MKFQSENLPSCTIKVNGKIKKAIDQYKRKKVVMRQLMTDFLAVKSKEDILAKAENPWAYFYKGMEGHEIESGVSVLETAFIYLVNGSEVHIDIYDDRMEIYSPGGMPDGSMIQDRDPLMVPSTRRNPVLADVFNRLGYMERKGSGFGKIISGYEFQINYDESKRPSFRSDRYQFTVVMPNLNYDVSHDFEENETMSESMSESMSKLERTRMQIILHYLDTNKEINSSI